MTTFLILFSLFLNILAILAIIILFLRQNRLLQVEKKQEKMITEMEEVISTYLLQMNEDNEAFINKIKKLEFRPASSNEMDSSKNDTNIKQEKDSAKEPLQNRIGKASAYKAANLYKQNAKAIVKETNSKTDTALEDHSVNLPALENNNDEMVDRDKPDSHSINHLQESTLLEQVLALKEQGFTEEKIAQKLNKGKTEIELLLKFQKNQ